VTNKQAILAEAKALAENETLSPEERIGILEELRDDFMVLIDELWGRRQHEETKERKDDENLQS
jgi:hypothetical protein